MKNFAKILSIIAVVIITGCKETTEDLTTKVEGLGGNALPNTAINKWLYDNFTKPYNIEVRYKWDAFEVPLDRTLVPPLEANVIPAMEAVKQIWIDTYEKEAGSNFIKSYSPKQYILVGSANWNTNGTITLGTAEGGRKIVLFSINDFDRQNEEGIKEMLHTIHHEFAHILHQNILYSVNYRQITPGTYTSNWNNISDEEALEAGYITPYSMSAPDEDFVEMIATMLVDGKAAFDAKVNSAQNPAARAALRQKEQIVVDYMAKAYNINFRSLQARTENAIKEYTK